MKSTLVFLLLAAALLGFRPGADAEASTVLAMSLEQMTERADTIFVGRVTGTRADWSSDRTRIYTYVTFEVDEYWKGGSASRVEMVRLLGGRVGPYLALVPGTPQFEEGEEVLVFCAGGGARIPTVLGLSLGKFTVVRGGEGEAIVKRDISSLMVAEHRTDARKPGDPVTRYALRDVESRVREFLR
jgi:hypothetical protein